MAHINHIRWIRRVPKMSAKEAYIDPHQSFGLFCGHSFQRDRLLLQLLSNYCGKTGIVFLHNNPRIERQLGNIYSLNPSLANIPGFKMILSSRTDDSHLMQSYYDPLYGLRQNEVLDVLAPLNHDGQYRMTSEVQSLRSILTDYLSIITWQFSKDPRIFGEYPFSLELLLELTEMSFAALQDKVLRFLPEKLSIPLTSRLSASGAQQTAYAAVNSFAQSVNGILWTPRGFRNHTKTSMIPAVLRRQMISINIPSGQTDVLDYLCCELQHLVNAGIPFLLVEYGINLNSSPRLKDLFLSEHTSAPYSTGIVAEDTSGITASDHSAELAALFGQTQEMFVFSCSSTIAARPFSDGIGSYHRQVTDHHTDRHRQPFHIFTASVRGDVQHETSQRIIDPEELTTLGTGCLLYGRNHPVPVLVNNFTFE